MPEIIVIPFHGKYLTAVRSIYYQTGYIRQDLRRRYLFDEKNLFCLAICDYYLKCEPHNCFAAINTKEEVVGYIIGITNTKDITKHFVRTILPKVLGRFLR